MFTVSSPALAWVVIFFSGSLEIVFSISMKFSDGYSRPFYSAVSVCSAVLSVWLVSTTLEILPIGTAYAVWAGIGAAGTALIGVLWLGEPATLMRFICIGAVVAGIVGLQLIGTA
ncbi:multidrug efflux SMR transporter [Rhodoferax sp. GW822-FHT02A01]|uniref:DMT family transporter n=1 Tax=Rhodoferax sp. GW822-FHT02A01 TaxID=3141537 RepID=UPI00315CBFDF